MASSSDRTFRDVEVHDCSVPASGFQDRLAEGIQYRLGEVVEIRAVRILHILRLEFHRRQQEFNPHTTRSFHGGLPSACFRESLLPGD